MATPETFSTQEVLVEVERGLRAFKAFEQAHKLISHLANIEQLQRESNQRADAAKQAADLAETQAGARIQQANARAAHAEEAAKTSGDATLSSALAEASRIAEKSNQEIQRYRDEKKQLLASMEIEHGKLFELKQSVSETQAELSALQGQLKAAREAKDALLRA